LVFVRKATAAKQQDDDDGRCALTHTQTHRQIKNGNKIGKVTASEPHTVFFFGKAKEHQYTKSNNSNVHT